MSKDYYKILGVNKSASKEDIKKAFRTLAHKYHPDKKGGDETKFKEASEAYSILSDDKRRAEYDAYGRVFTGGGSHGFGGQTGFEGFDFSNLNNMGFDFDLGDIFGGFSDIFGGKAGRRGRDISIDIELSFKESIFGVTRKILVTKDSMCLSCRGSGAEPGTKTKACPTCNGKGQVVESRRSPFGVFSVTQTCGTCKGRKVVPEKECSHCKGRGVERREEEISIVIAPGIDNGQVIRMSAMGEALAGGQTGDLYVKVHVHSDAKFRKEGYNIVTELPLKVTDALLGRDMTIETLDGPTKITVPPLRSADEILRLKGKGVPMERGRRGDFLIRIRMEFPHRLTKEARELLDKLKGEGI